MSSPRSNIDERKRLFKEHLLRFVPLTGSYLPGAATNGRGVGAPRMRFDVELEDHLTPDEAERTLRAATAWGRYAELFAYDDKTQTFSAIAKAP